MSRPLTRPAWLPGYIPELDGLRGIAILMVVLYHCADRLDWLPGGGLLHWGWAGVDLFFVLSGFLITGILAETRSSDPWLRNFYIRRTLRIWPLYFGLLLAFAVIAARRSDPFAASLRPTHWLLYLVFVQNLFHWAMPAPLGPTWSLAIEEQFYVVWAPVARVLRADWLKWVAVAVIVISPALRYGLGGRVTPVNTLVHLDGLAWGALLALLLRSGLSHASSRKLAACAFAAGVLATAFFVPRGTAFLTSALSLMFAGAVGLAATLSARRSALVRVLRFAWLRFLGTISYGLYLVHIAVFAHAGMLDPRLSRYGHLGLLAEAAVRILGAIGVASVLWYGFEKPILGMKSRFGSDKPSPAPSVAEPLTVGAD